MSTVYIVVNISAFFSLKLQIVKRNVRTQCRCYGLSGSCSIKVCYLSLPSFNDVGRGLCNRYDNARRVERLPGSPFLSLPNSLSQPEDTDLVYIQESPSYCVRDDRYVCYCLCLLLFHCLIVLKMTGMFVIVLLLLFVVILNNNNSKIIHY